MKEKIIEIIEKCSSYDYDWDSSYQELKTILTHVHPEFYELTQSVYSAEEIYDIIKDYKPLILDPIKDKNLLKEKYNMLLDIESFPENESMEVLFETFELSFNLETPFSQFIFCIEDLFEEQEEPFTFEEFYKLWLDKKLK